MLINKVARYEHPSAEPIGTCLEDGFLLFGQAMWRLAPGHIRRIYPRFSITQHEMSRRRKDYDGQIEAGLRIPIDNIEVIICQFVPEFKSIMDRQRYKFPPIAGDALRCISYIATMLGMQASYGDLQVLWQNDHVIQRCCEWCISPRTLMRNLRRGDIGLFLMFLHELQRISIQALADPNFDLETEPYQHAVALWAGDFRKYDICIANAKTNYYLYASLIRFVERGINGNA